MIKIKKYNLLFLQTSGDILNVFIAYGLVKGSETI